MRLLLCIALLGTAACEQRPLQIDDYAVGKRRTSGSKANILSNSVFADPATVKRKHQPVSTAVPNRQIKLVEPNAPSSPILVNRQCSRSYATKAKSTLGEATNGVAIAFHPDPKLSPDLAPVIFQDPTEALRRREGILNEGSFPIKLGQVPSGTYSLLVCDYTHRDSCAKPVKKNSSYPSRVGILASATVTIERGRLQTMGGPQTAGGKLNLLVGKHQVTDGPSESCDRYLPALIVDTDNKGIDLLPPTMPPSVSLENSSQPNFISWPRSKSSMFLVLAGEQAIPFDFDLLARLDSNNDNTVDIRDPGYKNLRLWSDANGDASLSADEVFSLSKMGVTSIDLKTTNATEKDQWGNKTKKRATIVINNQPRMIADVWFRFGN